MKEQPITWADTPPHIQQLLDARDRLQAEHDAAQAEIDVIIAVRLTPLKTALAETNDTIRAAWRKHHHGLLARPMPAWEPKPAA